MNRLIAFALVFGMGVSLTAQAETTKCKPITALPYTIEKSGVSLWPQIKKKKKKTACKQITQAAKEAAPPSPYSGAFDSSCAFSASAFSFVPTVIECIFKS